MSTPNKNKKSQSSEKAGSKPGKAPAKKNQTAAASKKKPETYLGPTNKIAPQGETEQTRVYLAPSNK
jgi:hypothetical protein